MTGFDVSSLISGSGIQLEQQAYNTFGAAVDQYTESSLGDFITRASSGTGLNPFAGTQPVGTGPGNGQGYVSLNGAYEYNTTPYAMDLINYQPKHRFLFKVIFDTYDSQNFNNLLGGTSHDKSAFQYVIKHIDKPTISFEYEDVNYYNFRTKVLKFIRHDALSMTMIDDINNTFHNFFTGYMKSHSPISKTYNVQTQASYDELKSNGFQFNDLNGSNGVDSAIRGVLPNNNYNILSSIRIFQYFAQGTKVNVFRFINPRIIDFNFEEASHEGSDQGNHCTIRFDYDALFLEPTKQVSGEADYPAPMTDLYISGGGGGPLDKINNPFSSFLSSALSQQASSLLGGLTNQALGGLAGSNPYLSSAINTGASALGNIGRNTVFGMTSGQSPSIFTQATDSLNSAASSAGDAISEAGSSAVSFVEDLF